MAVDPAGLTRLSRPDAPYFPAHLLLQWHLTERCNLRCTHCYQENYQGRELTFDEWLGIVEQFKSFLQAPPVPGRPAVRGHITVTGGEPLVRPDFFALLEHLAAERRHFSFAVLTNGTLIDAAAARRFKALGVGFVQVSLEGTPETHDRIRGAGNFQRAVAGIEHLLRAGVRTMISFTAHTGNYREFSDVVRLGRKLKVWRVWADRLIPQGHGAALSPQLLTPEQTREFFQLMLRAQQSARRAWFGRTEVSIQRALQFLVGGGLPYHCTAGDTLVTLQANGDLLPCRRMPIPVGNLLETRLADLYARVPLFHALRDRERISAGCERCEFFPRCRGGLRCLAYAVTGDPFRADPGCWLSTVYPLIHNPQN